MRVNKVSYDQIDNFYIIWCIQEKKKGKKKKTLFTVTFFQAGQVDMYLLHVSKHNIT